jgi:hypothetical protein
VVHAEVLGYGATRFPGCQAFSRFLLLMVGQLGLAPHVDTALARLDAALVGAPKDAVAFVLGQGGEEGKDAAIDGLGEVEVIPVGRAP